MPVVFCTSWVTVTFYHHCSVDAWLVHVLERTDHVTCHTWYSINTFCFEANGQRIFGQHAELLPNFFAYASPAYLPTQWDLGNFEALTLCPVWNGTNVCMPTNI